MMRWFSEVAENECEHCLCDAPWTRFMQISHALNRKAFSALENVLDLVYPTESAVRVMHNAAALISLFSVGIEPKKAKLVLSLVCDRQKLFLFLDIGPTVSCLQTKCVSLSFYATVWYFKKKKTSRRKKAHD